MKRKDIIGIIAILVAIVTTGSELNWFMGLGFIAMIGLLIAFIKEERYGKE